MLLSSGLAAPVRLELTTLGLTGSPINADRLLILHCIQNNYPKYTQIWHNIHSLSDIYSVFTNSQPRLPEIYCRIITE